MLICQKEPGILSQSDENQRSMETLVSEELGTRVSAVHRLDAPVGGCMVMAKSKKSAAALCRAVADHLMKKEYLAIVKGDFTAKTGTLSDLLYHDPRTNKTFVVDRKRRGVRQAILHYKVLETTEIDGETWNLVSIILETGRTHQIRVQFGSRKHPLWGDSRYGGRGAGFGLWAHAVEIPHPTQSKKVAAVSLPPDQIPWNYFPISTILQGRNHPTGAGD